MHKYRCEYIYCLQFGKPKHCWAVVGARGAIHVHITDYGDNEKDVGRRYIGGVEMHYRNPPTDTAPDHDNCWLLKGPCWHDGSSTAVERYINMWLCDVHDHEAIWSMLQRDLESYLKEE